MNLSRKFWTNPIAVYGKVVFEKDPKKLVEKIIALVNKEKVQTIKCPGCI